MADTLWSKGTTASDIVEDFTVGNDRALDLKLAKYDGVKGPHQDAREHRAFGQQRAGDPYRRT